MHQTLLTEDYVVDAISLYLKEKGWSHNLSAKYGKTHGVDIKVRNDKYGRSFLIECKGDPGEKVKSPRSSREASFNGALGQILTRMIVKTGNPHYKYGNKYGIGFPISFENIVMRRIPWSVSHKLNLYIFFVEANGTVRQVDWRELKKYQLNSKV